MKELGPEASALLDAARWGDEPTAADEKRVLAAIGKHLAASSAVVALVDTASKRSRRRRALRPRRRRPSTRPGRRRGSRRWRSLARLESGHRWRSARRIARFGGAMATENRPPASLNLRTLGGWKRWKRSDPKAQHRARRTPGCQRPSFGPAPVHESRARGAVAAEVRMLTEAQADIQAGDASALGYPRRSFTSVPKGALVEEREAARIAALCALGRVTEAREAADRFVRATPRSPQVGSVRASCGDPLQCVLRRSDVRGKPMNEYRSMKRTERILPTARVSW